MPASTECGHVFTGQRAVILHNFQSKNKEKELKKDSNKKFLRGGTGHGLIRRGLLAAIIVAASGIAFAQDTNQDKKDEMTFGVSPNTNTSGTLAPPQGNSE